MGNIKSFLRGLWAHVEGFFAGVAYAIHLTIEWLKTGISMLKWPVWYVVLLHIISFLVVVEVLAPGFIWGAFMLGFVVWGIKNTLNK